MIEFLVVAMQALCIFGLLCGAYLAISFGEKPIPVAQGERYDPVTAHSWKAAHRSPRYARV